MHTATRLALPVLDRVRAINPAAHICAYGLYAPLNGWICCGARGVDTILGGEFEADLGRPGAVDQQWGLCPTSGTVRALHGDSPHRSRLSPA